MIAVGAKSPTCSSPWQPGLFRPPGIELLPAYGTVTVCTVVGTLAPHAFVGGGSERRTATVVITRDRTTISSGIDGLLILKTTESAFKGFLRDSFTTLKETNDRIFATITGDHQHPVVRGAGGRELTQEEVQALEGIFRLVGGVFELTGNLLKPVAAILLLSTVP